MQVIYAIILKQNLQFFSDSASDKPLRFLKDLKSYIDMFNLYDKLDLNFTIKKSLDHKAKTWWHVVQDSVKSWEDFEAEILNSFWNRSVQNNVR